MSRPNPRRPSRTTTSRPRKLAGQTRVPVEAASGPLPEDEPATSSPPPDPGGSGEEATTFFATARATRALMVVLGGLVVLLVVQSAWWVRHSTIEDPEPEAVPEGTIAVPAGRPVLITLLAAREGVDAASQAARTIVERTWQDYDREVEEAVTLMTPEFAAEYRRTTEDIEREFVAQRTEVSVQVVGEGVVRANDTELQALIFLNQFVSRGRGEEARTAVTPYRALVTMVHTDDGWLVDGLDTR